jgi:hypothetical protein
MGLTPAERPLGNPHRLRVGRGVYDTKSSTGRQGRCSALGSCSVEAPGPRLWILNQRRCSMLVNLLIGDGDDINT